MAASTVAHHQEGIATGEKVVVEATRAPTGRHSLQRQLIISHAALVLLALALVMLMSGIFLRRYEQTAQRVRLEQLAVPLVAEANVASRDRLIGGATSSRRIPIAALDAQAAAMEVRLLLLDADGKVRYDTDEGNDLQGQTLAAYAPTIQRVLAKSRESGSVATTFLHTGSGDPIARQQVMIAAGPTGGIQPQRAIALISAETRVPLVRLFLPRLLLVSGCALVFASLVGYLLSKRIASPIGRLTTAADAMANGSLDQVVAGGGPRELDRLVASFNTMSRQVSATSRSQRELLANVAHELRTPLTSVQGYAQALQEGVARPGEETSRALASISRESERMATLIGQLLDLARLESGQATLQPVVIEMESLLRRTGERFRPVSQAKGVGVVIEAGPGVAVWGEEVRLSQLFANLLDNAIRHTPAGGRVTLRSAPLVAAGGAGRMVRTVVEDTGTGIPADQLPHIFERFQRGPGRESNGFGIGLALVREIVLLHHGEIWVQSTPGQGTTFTIDLPLPPAA